MRTADTLAPELLPVLAPGRHRNPRSGACFMEFASYLAGERWSDHPSCTHPLLAALARGVNDCTSDEARGRLVPLIPRVIGLTSTDPRLTIAIALRAAVAAIPVASLERQRALGVGVLSLLEALGDLDGQVDERSAQLARAAFDQAPDAERWADRYLRDSRMGRIRLPDTRSSEALVRTAILGIAEACVDDVDDRLARLLTDAVEESERFVAPVTETVPSGSLTHA